VVMQSMRGFYARNLLGSMRTNDPVVSTKKNGHKPKKVSRGDTERKGNKSRFLTQKTGFGMTSWWRCPFNSPFLPNAVETATLARSYALISKANAIPRTKLRAVSRVSTAIFAEPRSCARHGFD